MSAITTTPELLDDLVVAESRTDHCYPASPNLIRQATMTQAIQTGPTSNKTSASPSVRVDTRKSITFGVTGGWVMRPNRDSKRRTTNAKE